MAKLTCKDGTIIKISDETEAELRKAFEPKPPYYKDDHLECEIGNSLTWPIMLTTGGQFERITRNVEAIEAFIVALQKAVAYCKQHNLGV